MNAPLKVSQAHKLADKLGEGLEVTLGHLFAHEEVHDEGRWHSMFIVEDETGERFRVDVKSIS